MDVGIDGEAEQLEKISVVDEEQEKCSQHL